MTSVRILHVDDEPDIREVVEISLSLDPAFAVRSCASGGDALAATADWSPDLILLDVMMPDMDGPMTLARLRERPQTAEVPVVFMTARAQASELDRFLSLGAAGVIAKPFDPMTLAALVRRYAPAAETRIGTLRNAFLLRARTDAKVLAELRGRIENGDAWSALNQIEGIAHGLSEAASIYGFYRLSGDAGTLEDAAASGSGRPTTDVRRAIDALIVGVESEAVRTADA
jgi:CheY-like chemotaxis protein/HPt (histidine-containing phosphotransfer) domain-containing protein